MQLAVGVDIRLPFFFQPTAHSQPPSEFQRLPDFVHPTNDKGNALVGFVLGHSRKPVFY